MDVVVELAGAELRFADGALVFPIELAPPRGFVPARPSTWPAVNGRLEYVGGRLLFLAPCADDQQDVAVDVVFQLRAWAQEHPDFRVGGNEAGMLLGGDARGAEAAVWRRQDLGTNTGGFRRVPPILAVEVAGLGEDEATLDEKARWYLRHGVHAVWLVFPRTRSVVVRTASGTRRAGGDQRLPPIRALPGLTPRASSFFSQLEPRPSPRRRKH